MKVLSFSYCFPSHANRNWGIFVFQRLSALAQFQDLKVSSPVPWFPLLKSGDRNKKIQQEVWEGLETHNGQETLDPKAVEERT